MSHARLAESRGANLLPRQRSVVGNVIVLIFAVSLCLVNAAVWTLVSEMPMMGAGWALAAVACLFMQKWTLG
jgi:hypothetical protein